MNSLVRRISNMRRREQAAAILAATLACLSATATAQQQQSGGLKCYQCAVTRDNPGAQCPRESVLYQLDGWDSCMTWRLSNGRVILQNFVMADMDCTPQRIQQWTSVLRRIWRQNGTVECCSNLSAFLKFNSNDRPRATLFESFLSNSVRMDFNSMVDRMTGIRQSYMDMGGSSGFRSDNQPSTVCRCRDGYLPLMSKTDGILQACHDPIIQSAVIGSRCLNPSHCSGLAKAVCLDDPMLQMATGIRTYKTCQCRPGYEFDETSDSCVETPPLDVTPLADLGSFQDGVDASVSGFKGCITSVDCGPVENIECRVSRSGSDLTLFRTRVVQDDYNEEAILADSDGLPSENRQDILDSPLYYDISGESDKRVEQEALDSSLRQEMRQDNGGNSLTGRCVCRSGYIPFKNDFDDSIMECRDPIRATSFVGGRCLENSHCRTLPNTECNTLLGVAGTLSQDIRTCQCRPGYRQDDAEDSGLVSGCVRDNLDVSLIIAKLEEELSSIGVRPSPSEDQELASTSDDNMINRFSNFGSGLSTLNNFGSNLGALSSNQDSSRPSHFGLGSGSFNGFTGTNLPNSNDNSNAGFGSGSSSFLTPLGSGEFMMGNYEPTNRPQLSDSEVTDSSEEEEVELLEANDAGDLDINDDAVLRGPETCRQEMIVVERDEWIPELQHVMRHDNVTGSRLAAFFSRIPNSSEDDEGLIIRLLSSNNPGQNMYFVQLTKGREIRIGRATTNVQGERSEIVQVTNTSDTVNWLEKNQYTGFWVVFHFGYIAVGVLDENEIGNPLVSWTDTTPYSGIDTIGFTTLGSAAFYKVECSLGAAYPGGACASNEDCASLANTECRAQSLSSDSIMLQSCQCMPGYTPIPETQRTFVGGCYDPIMITMTLRGECLDDRHCTNLPNTECSADVIGSDERHCVCLPGTVPLDTNRTTGLVPGCSAVDQRILNTEVEACKTKFTLDTWVPPTSFRTVFDSARGTYSTNFYVRFASIDSTATVKLLDKTKNARKFYKISISAPDQVSIFENIRVPTFLVARNEERLKASVNANSGSRETDRNAYRGYWAMYQPSTGEVSIGRINNMRPLVSWTDISTTRDVFYVHCTVEYQFNDSISDDSPFNDIDKNLNR